MTLYEILGVEPTATPDEIKAAYRRKVKETHPDAQGDAAEFRKVQHAYDILADPRKREAYDRDGDKGEALAPPPAAVLAEAFDQVLDLDVFGDEDPVKGTELLLRERLKLENKRLKDHEREAEGWRKKLKRLERKEGREAILEHVLERRIEPHLRGAESARAWIGAVTLALKLVENYRYRSNAAREFFELSEILAGLDEEETAGKGAKPPRKRRAA